MNIAKSLVLAGFLLAALPAGVSGQGAGGRAFDLATLHQAAIDTDPRSRELQLFAQQTDLRLRNISALKLPALTVDSQVQYQSDVAHLPSGVPFSGIFAPPKDTYDAGIRIDQRLFDPTVGAQGALADVTWALGDLAAAEASFREVIAMRRSSPLVRKGSLGFQLGNLAGVLIERGDLASALIAAREALPLLSGVGNAWLFMEHLALRTMLVGSVANAARVAGFAAAAFDTNEVQRQPNEARAHARLYALLRDRIESDELKGLLAQGAEMTEEEACRIALAN